jgi:hypothetical protein
MPLHGEPPAAHAKALTRVVNGPLYATTVATKPEWEYAPGSDAKPRAFRRAYSYG